MERLEGELKGIHSKMTDLKKVLYDKFGDAINLEAEDDD